MAKEKEDRRDDTTTHTRDRVRTRTGGVTVIATTQNHSRLGKGGAFPGAAAPPTTAARSVVRRMSDLGAFWVSGSFLGEFCDPFMCVVERIVNWFVGREGRDWGHRGGARERGARGARSERGVARDRGDLAPA